MRFCETGNKTYKKKTKKKDKAAPAKDDIAAKPSLMVSLHIENNEKAEEFWKKVENFKNDKDESEKVTIEMKFGKSFLFFFFLVFVLFCFFYFVFVLCLNSQNKS